MALQEHEHKDDKEDNHKDQALLICRLLLLTIFFTTPTLGGLVKCWLACLGLEKEHLQQYFINI